MTRRLLTLAALALAPFIRSGVTDSLEVTPNSGTIDVPPYAQAHTQVFSVKNTGDRTVDIAITAADCQPYEMNCSWSTLSLHAVAPNDSVPLTVTFTAGAPGSGGTLFFIARVADNLSVSATAVITVRVPQQAWLETKSLNPGTTIERSHCVAFPIGTNAAYECGDLRIAHALPSLHVRNDDRTPVLVYNTAHAEPRPVVLANISAPSGGATNVIAKLSIRRGGNDVQVAGPTPFGTIPGDSTRRIALTYDASGDTTGVYPYTFTVTMTVGGSTQTLTSSDTLVVVNRKGSAFGAGWWVAGYERLVRLPGGGFLWVGGDGSTRRYVRDTTRAGEAYGAAGFERPDSLVLDGSVYVRQLRHRARVEFDANGRHVATKDPLGSVTTFDNEPTSGRLRTIIHPAASQPKHEFFYSGGSSPRLDSVTAPAPTAGGARRKVTITHAQRGKITRITDADTQFVGFGYQFTNSVLVWFRTNRNNVNQHFALTTNRLVWTAAPLNISEQAEMNFCPAEIRGLATNGCGSSPLSPSAAVTTVDGPRTDVSDLTTIKTDRFGGPEIVTDPLGRRTRLYRGDRSLPALVTRSIGKNFKAHDAFYNASGTLGRLVDYGPVGPGRDAVTTFQWDPKWERVTQITYPEGNVVRLGYDSATGNRIWQEDGRGTPSRVEFTHHSSPTESGHLLLASVIHPADPAGVRDRDTLLYDALGNLREERRAVGTSSEGVTRFGRDGVGRIRETRVLINTTGAEQVDSTTYDVMDRVVQTRASGAGTTPPGEFLQTHRTYDLEGNLRRVERSASGPASGTPVSTLVSRWGYDLANRVIADTAVDGRVETHTYDAAGNDTLFRTRRGHTVRMVYDALNRLQTRTLSQVTYEKKTVGIASFGALSVPENKPYPRRPIDAGLAPVDTVIGLSNESFTYDEVGNVLTANNGDAQVQRTYFLNGLVETETLRVRAYGGTDFSTHTYLTRYEYDLNGRRTGVVYPAQFGGGTATSDYRYSATTGALDRVTDPLGATFNLHIDLRGQLDTLYLPGGVTESFAYDAAGRLIGDRIHTGTGTPLRLTSRSYDARDKVLTSTNTTGALDSHTAAYTGLGYLATSSYSDHGVNPYGSSVAYTSNETLTHDGMGNLFSAHTITTGSTSASYTREEGTRTLRYEATTGRVRAMVSATRQDTTRYDLAGNAELTHYPGTVASGMEADRAVYYDALGRVRAVDHRFANGGAALSQMLFTFEEFRYDALGRRVLARTRRFCRNVDNIDCAVETIRRTIWDGSQELAEIQMPGGDTVSVSTLENDVQPLGSRPGFVNVTWVDLTPFYGRVAYTHALGIDRPLSLARYNYADSLFNRPLMQWEPFSLVPHWNVRGEADNGSFADGGLTKCTTDGVGQRCVQAAWPFGWTATAQRAHERRMWHGSLVENKRDGSGLLFRRNRYVDPANGRFTQEDPIGLVGGINLYGFAGGDPVNFSDPFGLCPVCLLAWGAYEIGSGIYDVYSAIKTFRDPNATPEEKSDMVYAAAASAFGPGGGYTAIVGRTARSFPRDFATKNTRNWTAIMANERDARNLARAKLGKGAVELEPGKWRSRDGKWQYRAKPGDLADNHVNLEELDPRTGEVLQNAHLRWKPQ